MGFPSSLVVKNLPANAGDASSIPGSGRSSGEGNGSPLPYYCLKNPMDRGAWRSTTPGVAKRWTRLSNWAHTRLCTQGLPDRDTLTCTKLPPKCPQRIGQTGKISGLISRFLVTKLLLWNHCKLLAINKRLSLFFIWLLLNWSIVLECICLLLTT